MNAVVTLLAERCLRQTAESAERWAHGTARPLEGIPFGLKDIIATQGIRTTGGCRLYADHVPEESASVTQRLEAAGYPPFPFQQALTAAGLPLGIQIVARPFDEATAFRVGNYYQQMTSHHQATPPILTKA